ncbi:MAG: DUF4922 domain-containing protein, partial [Candidatus Omnitrophica bacterium]|nr:DUF4922 domain-containing protein [Candidatus Omnitrophota bacterium]
MGIPEATIGNRGLLELLSESWFRGAKAALFKLNFPLIAPLIDALVVKSIDTDVMIGQAIPAVKAAIHLYIMQSAQEEAWRETVSLGVHLVERGIFPCSTLQFGVPLAGRLARGNIAWFKINLSALKELAIRLGCQGINVYETLLEGREIISRFGNNPDNFSKALNVAALIPAWRKKAREFIQRHNQGCLRSTRGVLAEALVVENFLSEQTAALEYQLRSYLDQIIKIIPWVDILYGIISLEVETFDSRIRGNSHSLQIGKRNVGELIITDEIETVPCSFYNDVPDPKDMGPDVISIKVVSSEWTCMNNSSGSASLYIEATVTRYRSYYNTEPVLASVQDVSITGIFAQHDLETLSSLSLDQACAELERIKLRLTNRVSHSLTTCEVASSPVASRYGSLVNTRLQVTVSSPLAAEQSPSVAGMSFVQAALSLHHKVTGRLDPFTAGILLHLLFALRIYDLVDVIKALSYQQRKIGFVNEDNLATIRTRRVGPYEVVYVGYRDPTHYEKGVKFEEPNATWKLFWGLKWLKKFKLDSVWIFEKLFIRNYLFTGKFPSSHGLRCNLCWNDRPLIQRAFAWRRTHILMNPFPWTLAHGFVVASRKHTGKSTELIDSEEVVKRAFDFVDRAPEVLLQLNSVARSIPEHFHFQGTIERYPIEDGSVVFSEISGGVGGIFKGSVYGWPIEHTLLRSQTRAALEEEVYLMIQEYMRRGFKADMIDAYFKKGRNGWYSVFIFPRTAKSPSGFYVNGWGVPEMSGKIIVVREEEFESATPKIIAEALQQVGVPVQSSSPVSDKLFEFARPGETFMSDPNMPLFLLASRLGRSDSFPLNEHSQTVIYVSQGAVTIDLPDGRAIFLETGDIITLFAGGRLIGKENTFVRIIMEGNVNKSRAPPYGSIITPDFSQRPMQAPEGVTPPEVFIDAQNQLFAIVYRGSNIYPSKMYPISIPQAAIGIGVKTAGGVEVLHREADNYMEVLLIRGGRNLATFTDANWQNPIEQELTSDTAVVIYPNAGHGFVHEGCKMIVVMQGPFLDHQKITPEG